MLNAVDYFQPMASLFQAMQANKLQPMSMLLIHASLDICNYMLPVSSDLQP